MTEQLVFATRGTPVAQGSKNAFKHKHTDKIVMVETAHERLQVWRMQIYAAARKAALKAHWQQPEAARVDITFYLPRPKSHLGTGRNTGKLRPSAPRFPNVKPDGDKLTRAVYDALTQARVLKDDANVVDGEFQKRYADLDHPGAKITITKVDQT